MRALENAGNPHSKWSSFALLGSRLPNSNPKDTSTRPIKVAIIKKSNIGTYCCIIYVLYRKQNALATKKAQFKLNQLP